MQIKAVLLFPLMITFLTVGYFLFKGTEWDLSLPSRSSSLPETRGYIQEIKAYAEEQELNNLKTYQCEVPQPTPGDIQLNNTYWQHLTGSDTFLYSAYYDPRYYLRGHNYHFVRIIGVVKGKILSPLYCHLWFSDQSNSFSVQAKDVEIWMNLWDKASSPSTYRAYLFSCPVPIDSKSKLTGISLSKERCEKPTVYFDVLWPSKNFKKEDFVVCVKGMDYQEDISSRLIEWLELQYLLGASKVLLYLYNVHPNTTKVLNYYTKLNKLSVIPLTLPGDLPNYPTANRTQFLRNNIWPKRRLELVPYNDCFYRHINTHRFVVLLDIDEAIVPIIHNDWKSLVDQVLSDVPQALEAYSSISAQNVYFFDGFPTEDDNHSIPPYMHMLKHVYRSANFSKPGYAIKSFFSTNNTLLVFNHYTLLPLYLSVQRNAIISETLAQLHHYRAGCPPGMDAQCRLNFMKYVKRDTLIWKYKKQLVDRVLKTLQAISLQND